MSRLLNRIAKLQQLAKSPNPNESVSAAAQALRLMREHAISQADVDAAQVQREDPLIECHLCMKGIQLVKVEEVRRYPQRTAGWKRRLMLAVSEYMGLRMAYDGGQSTCWYYGHASDVETAINLYNICARQIDRECVAWLEGEGARQRAKNHWWDPSEARTAGFGFRESAVEGLESKFEELQEESATDHGDGHALVLSRAQKVSDWVDKTYTFTKGTMYTGGAVDHVGAGYAVGRELRLTADGGLEDRQPRALT
jgi:uncharacterized protein DUF2786